MLEPLAIRPARPEDHAQFARFFTELGHDDPIPDAERWRAEMMPHTFFLEDAGTKVAYAFVEHYGNRGYVRHVVVDQDRRSRGVGREVMKAIAASLIDKGATEWELNVRVGNNAALKLYESVGMRADYSTFVLRFDWEKVALLPVAKRVACATTVEPHQDRAIEDAFGLPSGMVARLRSFEGNELDQLLDENGLPIAFARFDPAFPGAFPFRVKDVTIVRTLLEALRSHARPKSIWIQLVIENDADSADLLIAHGARLMFEILHLRGEIPR